MLRPPSDKSFSPCRQNLGFSPQVWKGLTDVLGKAIPVLEMQSFSWKNAQADSHHGSSSDLIAANYLSLVKDIERLNDLCTIARNLLATTKKAQNLAAEHGFDQKILKLIEVCVRVTARGFDGEANQRNEERWQKVVTLYKRLLITCLQFLHNFIMHNEHRKLVLWLDLFGNQQPPTGDLPPADAPETQVVQAAREARIKATVERLPHPGTLTAEGGLGYNIDDVHALFDLMSTEKPPDGTTQEAARQLMDKIRSDMERLSGLSASQLDENPEALLKVGAALRAQLPAKDFPLQSINTGGNFEQQVRRAATEAQRTTASGPARALDWTDLPDLSQYPEISTTNTEITEDDMAMPRTAQSAAETLQEAKAELMAKLQETTPMIGADGQQIYDPNDAHNGAVDDDIHSTDGVADSIDDEDEDEDDEDDDYQSPGDQERGLLTDVPLVLGPTEIEALPMIIQAGIVDSFGLKGGERNGTKNMQAVRCHILLAQEAGRNVLRELLIFIAAWDLPDDEFYFKMMVQIMEAILKNGLMSHAYSDFGQAKDIISPAQAVVIKILTHIFRAKYSPASVIGANANQPPTPRIPGPLTRVDVLTVRYIFTVFRGNIIPETCALIYLQGQIRQGKALAEDFPLNLWDMERVYEGVYQFLEFFAVLTESNDWKALLVEWEIVYDLVTLIKELDRSIPKASLTSQMPPATVASASRPHGENQHTVTPAKDSSSGQTPVAIERPYESTAGDGVAPELAANAVPPVTGNPDNGPSQSLGTEDPSEFEWRNLKKLIVLVLSSLVWKSPVVQNQIREHEGVEVILSCTQYDAHNPYIKEHAVMCLKFLLENNRANQSVVEALEAQEIVAGQDVLREAGMEAVVSEEGRVKLVRSGMGRAHGPGSPGTRQQRLTNEGALREPPRRLNVNGTGTNGSATNGPSTGREKDDLDKVYATGGFLEEAESVRVE
jgi:palmitoyltransferase